MGFFSKIKKFWDVDQRLDKAVEEYKTERGMPEETPAGEATVKAPPAQAKPVPPAVAAPTAPKPADVGAPSAKVPPKAEAWQNDLLLSLRKAEPRLSIWLSIVLEGVDKAGPQLWERLLFLFKALEAPEAEAKDFVERFRKWLDDMEYVRVPEFRSELQFRLALALELEDEEDERNRLLLKLSEGLEKTKEQISKRIEGLMASHSKIDESFWEELEEILIMADVGFEPSMKLIERLRDRVRKAGTDDPARFKEFLREELETIFKAPKRITAINPPEVVMMIGVNGVGKTTTIAKLAYRAQMQGRRVLIAAGDTFRAAAIEQLEIWAKRVGAGFYSKGAGADPAAVAFEAVDKAVSEGYDLLLLDTAGRLHTKINLMEELKKIQRVCGKKHPGSPHRSILVVDATTGQNALQQAKLFGEAVGVDEIILTKLDGTAKGGIVVAIALEHALPITFVGLGEKMEDLRPFNGKDFAQALLGT
ncbi:signal recognition particle-docking protein FtsY [Desulfocurvibacter africanus]|uniref:Signal recognition particle receptor FtsY n=1 Tax=Desulfocurvibacter africanus subsp. africanus str. Walvis Bay TaxID=690850 RepID=F3Z2X1_DESAF|nr:signal recognition particle-docking protein FtsY [Desulfocurvibacter africanus]EGJ51379.1 signal recognition particle-docking protein FtsY [Desulfocurvibacter africanus subsp. africanus str. Walvis Bay]